MSEKETAKTQYRPVFGVTPSGMRYLMGFAHVKNRDA